MVQKKKSVCQGLSVHESGNKSAHYLQNYWPEKILTSTRQDGIGDFPTERSI